MRFIILLSSLMLLAGCASHSSKPSPTIGGKGNPASVYCVQQGGVSEIRDSAQGQQGLCQLPNGRLVDEWDFYRSSQQKSSVSQ